MTSMSKTVIFFGTDTFSATALKSLIEAQYSIGAVVTKPDSKSGRGQRLTSPLVKQIAEQHNIPVWQPAKLIDIIDDIKEFDDPIGVLSSYGRIIPQAIIDLFIPGIINIHPSLLPLYRGPSPIETAILNGDTRTGVSIMKLTAEMDAGPIYAQEVYELDGSETAPQLYEELSALGGRMLIETLPGIIEGNILASPQANAAIYCYLLKKEDAYINPEEITAVEAERHIRAFLSFPKTKLTLLDQSVIVTKAHVSSEKVSALDIAFKDGQFLSIDELIGPSGRNMSGTDFLNGYTN